MIKYKSYNLNKQTILSPPNQVLFSYVSLFWEEVFTNRALNPNKKVGLKHLMVLCKVRYSENEVEFGYKTLGPIRRVEFRDLDLFKNYLSGRLGILIDSYTNNTISEISFTYVIKDGVVADKDRLLLEDLSDKEVTFHEFNKIKLPVSMDPAYYGTIRGKSQLNGEIKYFVRNNNSSRI
jgi:hypothetical protein